MGSTNAYDLGDIRRMYETVCNTVAVNCSSEEVPPTPLHHCDCAAHTPCFPTKQSKSPVTRNLKQFLKDLSTYS